MISENLKHSAVSNAMSSITKDECFPKNVFIGAWKDYFFFESNMLFQPIFIKVKNLLLREESASAVALINLGSQTPIGDQDLKTIFLEGDTIASDYIEKLKGDGSPMNWLFLMDRYVCASDKGHWAIYCEKENDIAVFAVRSIFSSAACSQVGALLKAKSIKRASEPEDSCSFDFNPLLPTWTTSLITEYVPSDE
jgi:hypothetical protein